MQNPMAPLQGSIVMRCQIPRPRGAGLRRCRTFGARFSGACTNSQLQPDSHVCSVKIDVRDLLDVIDFKDFTDPTASFGVHPEEGQP